ncbi:hypothetical protein M1146_00050 [Patescibacteria group bacterium]|nr:hypothetical protein [Patescibacteria group bacterium]
MIGVLGAIDPYAHKTEIEKRKLLQMQEMIDEGSEINDLSLTSMNETLDRFDPSPDYYHIVAVKVPPPQLMQSSITIFCFCLTLILCLVGIIKSAPIAHLKQFPWDGTPSPCESNATILAITFFFKTR